MAMRLQRLEDTLPRIETLLASVDDRLRKAEIDLAEIKGRIAHLPSTWAMITTMLGGQVAFAAAILAILRIVGSR
jgi:septal ring factor EnvC (AmiA/AmiB activator)